LVQLLTNLLSTLAGSSVACIEWSACVLGMGGMNLADRAERHHWVYE